MPKYLLDASAIYPLILKLCEKILKLAPNLFILDLTVYEVGNAIWKGFKLGLIRNPIVVMELFSKLMNSLNTISIRGDEAKVLEIAISEGLTFYDASYLYVARSKGMKLVTEDEDLLRFPEAINVSKFVDELNSQLLP